MKWFLKALALVSMIAAELPEIVADGKITVREALDLATKIAEKLGFDVDDEGLELQPKTDG